MIRTASCAVAAAALLSQACLPAAGQRAVDWDDLEPTKGPALVAVLADGTTVILTTGGAKNTKIFEQRRTPNGDYGPRSLVLDPDRGNYCTVDLVDVQQSTVALGGHCMAPGQLEDRPSIAQELVWTEAGGWTSTTHRQSDITSVDVSPSGEHVVFATDNEYFGKPEHVTTYDVGGDAWTDRAWDERGPEGDRLAAAVDDTGQAEVIRSTAFEDEPGAWIGGLAALMHWDEGAGAFVEDFRQRIPRAAVTNTSIDLGSDGQVFANFVRHYNAAERLWFARGTDATTVTARAVTAKRSEIFANSAATTASGVAAFAWQMRGEKGRALGSFGYWAPVKPTPRFYALPKSTTTAPIRAGLGIALSLTGSGHVTLAWVTHSHDERKVLVYGIDGALRAEAFAVATWPWSERAALQASAGAGGANAVLIADWDRYFFGPRAAVAYYAGPAARGTAPSDRLLAVPRQPHGDRARAAR